VTCSKCGHELRVGDFPFCKGGHGPYNVNVIDDQIEGGPRFFENFGAEPVWIGSKSEWRAAVDRYQVVNVDKHDRAYYQRKFREHDERIRDTGVTADGLRVR
jgi:hypothetical protein